MSKKVVLTIDDGPSSITEQVIDYLIEREIHPIMFFIGKNMEKYSKGVDYAINHNITIGNHSYSHANFDDLSLEECIKEILTTEKLIDGAYERNNKNRINKYFRFPYGSKGKHKSEIQEYLYNHNFTNELPIQINYEWYYKNKLNEDIDIFWTFDCEEYKMQSYGISFWRTIIAHINENNPQMGGSMSNQDSDDIVLLHDHEESNSIKPNYYRQIMQEIMKKEVEIV